MGRTLLATPAQVAAARLLVHRAEARGADVDEAVRALAKALPPPARQPLRPQQVEIPTTTGLYVFSEEDPAGRIVTRPQDHIDDPSERRGEGP